MKCVSATTQNETNNISQIQQNFQHNNASLFSQKPIRFNFVMTAQQ